MDNDPNPIPQATSSDSPIIVTKDTKPRNPRKKPASGTGSNQNQGGNSNPNHKHGGANKQGGAANPKPAGKLRGQVRDSPEVRLSKTLSWILRHGAKSEGLKMRPDGYIKVTDLLANPKLQSLDFAALQEIVKADAKNRYDLLCEPGTTSSDPGTGIWWMRANQGHSMKSVQLELEPITSAKDIPTGIAVHGTNAKAWESISKQGLSKMKRNHIHLAQGVAGEDVISGMRTSSQILIYIDVQKALDAGIRFFLSANGVVLTEGDGRGFLGTQFFRRVENAKRVALSGWEGVMDSPVAHVAQEKLVVEGVP